VIELVGMVATALVLVSFLFKKQSVTRAINMAGAALFVVYGICIASPSVWVMNGALILVHIYYLFIKKK
jgi:uncharacterized protein with PQ loop repeat